MKASGPCALLSTYASVGDFVNPEVIQPSSGSTSKLQWYWTCWAAGALLSTTWFV
jgi:hypothetical protein